MSLHTLAAPAAHAAEIRHSRFLAQAAPVATSSAAMAWLRMQAHAAATHHCWAWRVGAEHRSSDDGEPSGTAGRPILAAIDAQGLDRVAVVVTRWYGGIKLGAGGLARAYGGTAPQCLRLAPRLPLVAQVERVLRCGFQDLGAVHALLPLHGAEKLEERFCETGTELRIRLPQARLDALTAQLRDITHNRVRVDS